MKSTRSRRLSLRFGLLAGTAAVIVLIQIIGLSALTTPLERIEYSARDVMMRLAGGHKPTNDIVIVAVDDHSFGLNGLRWPWPRSYVAEIVDQLNRGGAKVVGLDFILSTPDTQPGNDEQLAKSLTTAASAVGEMQIIRSTKEGYVLEETQQPIDILSNAFDAVGITSFRRDEDAIVRSVQAYDTSKGADYFNWAFEISRIFLSAPEPSQPTPFGTTFNGQDVPLRSGGDLLVNYAGPAGTFTTYSAADVHDGITLEQDPNAFRGKIVLVGATTVTLQDIYPTPFSIQTPMPGVEVVANAVDTILTGAYLREAPPWLALLITIAAAFLAERIARFRRPTLTLGLMAGAMLGYALVVLLLFISARYIVSIVAPEAMLVLGVVLPTLEQAVSQEREKRRVRNLFSRFISSEMVDQMMATQDLNSLNKRSDVTILFSDIRGFTTLSEKLPPEDVVKLLNPYLDVMSAVIDKHGGTVDKYEGDAIIAFFGEPVHYKDHAARALRAALDMRAALDELRPQWQDNGQREPLEMGIGINSGDVFVGLLGSAQRINYTIIGDNANLASRLQDLTKAYAWPVLISESTYQQVKDEFDAELEDAVVVKGKTESVNVYKVLGRKGAPASEQLKSWQK